MTLPDLSKDLWKWLYKSVGGPTSNRPAQEPLLQHARAFFRAEETNGLQSLVARKIEAIRHFDIAGMERALAICTCGRSGSILLASYLDGHDDVIMLPTSRSHRIYEFFERFESLSLHDKLIAYPFFSNDVSDFFQGELPIIAAADYYVAVKALFEVYGDWPLEFLESRRAFFQFVHIVYCVALGWRPASPRPLIVYALHFSDDQLARRFVKDFPQGRFIHTVRDPITNCGRLFEAWYSAPNGFFTAVNVIRHLTKSDKPHSGMESRTRAIRFEDIHLHLEKTMRAVADWLGLPYRSSLLDSTFNGVPWVVTRGTISWSGARPEQAVRDSQKISFTDQCLLFAVLNEDFVAWNYPCPNIFKHAAVRVLTCVLFLLLPIEIEAIAARALFKEFRSLRSGGLGYAINSLVRFFICRVAIISILAAELWRRLILRKKVLELL
jgi:hypothetical protein